MTCAVASEGNPRLTCSAVFSSPRCAGSRPSPPGGSPCFHPGRQASPNCCPQRPAAPTGSESWRASSPGGMVSRRDFSPSTCGPVKWSMAQQHRYRTVLEQQKSGEFTWHFNHMLLRTLPNANARNRNGCRRHTHPPSSPRDPDVDIVCITANLRQPPSTGAQTSHGVGVHARAYGKCT